jgi:hypothetical protein
LPSHLLKTHFNIILSPTPRISKRSLSFIIPYQRLSTLPIRSTCPYHLILLDLITRTDSVSNTDHTLYVCVSLLLCLGIIIYMYSYCYVYVSLFLYLCILIFMFMYSYCYVYVILLLCLCILIVMIM